MIIETENLSKLIEAEVSSEEITAAEDSQPGKETFDFSRPETVLFNVIKTEGKHEKFEWTGWEVEDASVIASEKPDVSGAASYESSYGGFLNYVVEDLAECPKKEGWFILESVTGSFSRGDGYTTDDDMDFYAGKTRPATQEEIDLA